MLVNYKDSALYNYILSTVYKSVACISVYFYQWIYNYSTIVDIVEANLPARRHVFWTII
jgi:hypothetical protein